jgi:UDP-N-acetylmuramoylalanine--D-glutamate ligase
LQAHVPDAILTICDANPECTHPTIPCTTWETYLDHLEQFDIVFRSPWISPHIPQLQEYTGLCMTQMQLFFDIYPGKIIGITWTKGKTTLSHLVYETLKQAWYSTILAWNVWSSVLDVIDIEAPVDRVVLELSSYQLYNLRWSLDIAIYNNLYFEHHVDRHGWFEAYKYDKSNIINLADYLLLGSQIKQDQPDLLDTIDFWTEYDIYGTSWTYVYKDAAWRHNKQKLIDDTWVLLLWEHNRYNICALVWVCEKLDIDIDILEQVLHSFSGVEHRLEDLWTHHSIRWINDAIATTPQSTLAALDTYKHEVDTIFLWWKDGGYDFKELIEMLAEYRVSNVILFPNNGKHILDFIVTHPTYSPFTHICTTMKEAVHIAKQNTRPWKIALLSCASPSYSLWKNFEEKGREFKECILAT